MTSMVDNVGLNIVGFERFKGCSKSRISFLKVMGAKASASKTREAQAEVALRKSPIQRDAITRAFGKGQSEGDDGFFDTINVVFSRAQDRERDAYTILSRSPVQGNTIACAFGKG